ncbi:PREDICTED: proline iminopeptidase isoform X2 [Theobroma cacao]|uniref:Proline iminopeptidase n=2 Tax=Theobroma cacao TaxID=3641 RepID=A0AB32W1I3_THECC|nr:PREDICTED: proline iminopeptidase isoform X2 [Theobroma cacao]
MRLAIKFVSKSNFLFTHYSLPTIPSSRPRFPRSLASISNNFTFSGKKKSSLWVQRVSYKTETQLSDLMESGKEIQELNRNLYPAVEPYSTGFLKVSDIHTIYWEQSGNPNGHPVVFLHGGPGGGTSPSNRTFFDPEFYRIILFDQRGAGKSTPHACLEENTTWDLIDDIEKLREHLEISEWQVFGGSWGSTLALAYSQSHPDKVTGLVLRGIFLLRKKEIDWFYEGGAAAIYPDAWEPFRDLIPENERESFVTAYHKRLNSNDLETQCAAARAWTKWEMMTAHLLPNDDNIKRGDDDNFSLGRYDVCCPMMSAWDLHKAFPEADFKVVSDAGHSANEPGIAAELVAANEKLKNLLKN